MNSAALGRPVFGVYVIEINTGDNLLKLLDMTNELNKTKGHSDGWKTIHKSCYLKLIDQTSL